MKFLYLRLNLQSKFSSGRQNQDCRATSSLTRSEIATEKTKLMDNKPCYNTQSQVIHNLLYILNVHRLVFTFLVHRCEGTQEAGKPMSCLCLSVERKNKMSKQCQQNIAHIIILFGQKNIKTVDELLKVFYSNTESNQQNRRKNHYQ